MEKLILFGEGNPGVLHARETATRVVHIATTENVSFSAAQRGCRGGSV